MVYEAVLRRLLRLEAAPRDAKYRSAQDFRGLLLR